MPLIKGKSKEVLAQNIAELHHANESKPEGKKRSDKQIVSIAYSVARNTRK